MTERTVLGRHLQNRNAELAAQEPLCQLCQVEGRVREGTQTDHIIPLGHDGPDTPENLWRLCDECHEAKTMHDCGRRYRPKIAEDGWPAGPVQGLTDRQLAEIEARQRRVGGGEVGF